MFRIETKPVAIVCGGSAVVVGLGVVVGSTVVAVPEIYKITTHYLFIEQSVSVF